MVLYQGQPEVHGKLPASPKTLETVRNGMFLAVNSDLGGANRARNNSIQLSGKTGTAEVKLRDNSKNTWFIGYGTRDYIKRSSIKSYKGCNGDLPGMKQGDALIAADSALTTDYVMLFTNQGNFITVPVHKLEETKWRDEGQHINVFCTLGSGEKIFKAIIVEELRNDIYLAILTKFGQIKRMSLASLDLMKRSRPAKFMKLLSDDEIVGVEVITGNSDLLVLTSNGNASMYNENELTILGSKAGGVKSIGGLHKTSAAALVAFDENEKSKVVVVTDKGHYRIIDNSRVPLTQRLGKVTNIMPMFKNDVHAIVGACKINKKEDIVKILMYLSNQNMYEFELPDTYLTEAAKYAKKNMPLEKGAQVSILLDYAFEKVDKNTISHPVKVKEEIVEEEAQTEESAPEVKEKKEEPATEGFEQISIFDDLDD